MSTRGSRLRHIALRGGNKCCMATLCGKTVDIEHIDNYDPTCAGCIKELKWLEVSKVSIEIRTALRSPVRQEWHPQHQGLLAVSLMPEDEKVSVPPPKLADTRHAHRDPYGDYDKEDDNEL
jgi:hypothetical protein